MRNSSTLAQRLPTETGSTVTELSARPKVMRRPAHFSAPQPEAPVTQPTRAMPLRQQLADELLIKDIALPPVAATAPARHWQDDARFGVVLLATVLMVNLILSLWLPHLKPVSTPAARDVMAPLSQPGAKQSDGLNFYYSQPEKSPARAPEEPVVHILGGTAEESSQ